MGRSISNAGVTWLGTALCLLGACAGEGDPNARMLQNGANGGTGGPAFGTGGAAGMTFGNSDASTPPPLELRDAGLGLDDDGCAAVTQVAESKKLPIDIIWAIDTSSSMQAVRDAIQTELNTLSQRIVDAGIDAHIVLLGSTDVNACFGPGLSLCIEPPLGSGQCGGGTLAVVKTGLGGAAFCASADIAGAGADSTEDFLHLNAASGETMQLDTILAQYPAYSQLLRPEAKKHLVITGDGDANQSFDQFSQALAALDPSFAQGDWQFSAVYCRETCLGLCPQPATVYPTFVQRSGGVEGSLCAGQAGFADVIDELATAVIVGAELACEWALPPPPPGETFDKDQVNVTYTPGTGAPIDYGKLPPGVPCDDREGWYYDSEDAPSKITVCPRTCDGIRAAPDGRMDIALGCATRLVSVD